MSREPRAAVVAALGAAVRAHQRAVDALDEAAAALFGVNRTDLRCLDLLLERGVVTPSALAEALGLTSGSVTAMLDRLERAGYVERAHDPSDRRRSLVRATPLTTERAQTVYGPLVEEGARTIDRYSVAELEGVLRFLQRDAALQDAHAARVRALSAVGLPPTSHRPRHLPPAQQLRGNDVPAKRAGNKSGR